MQLSDPGRAPLIRVRVWRPHFQQIHFISHLHIYLSTGLRILTVAGAKHVEDRLVIIDPATGGVGSPDLLLLELFTGQPDCFAVRSLKHGGVAILPKVFIVCACMRHTYLAANIGRLVPLCHCAGSIFWTPERSDRTAQHPEARALRSFHSR
jgi:hypothetical protein